MADGDASDDLVIEVDDQLAVLARRHEGEQVDEVLRVELGGLLRQARGEVGRADDDDAGPGRGRGAGDGERGVAARRGGHVDDDGAGPHAGERVGVQEQRGPAPGDGGGRDDDVGLGGLARVDDGC